jgi:hypothetical protein
LSIDMQVVWPRAIDDWQKHRQTVESVGPLRPFAEISIEFVRAISRVVLSDHAKRVYPDLMAMAYWFRDAALGRLQDEFHASVAGTVPVPRGIVLHFPPANVEVIFFYSWLLSLLVGNANIVRISQQGGPLMPVLLDLVGDLLAEPRFRAIRDRTLVVTYDHDDALTGQLSAMCDVRVIWGGDDTIKRIRAIPIQPRATELTFADRFSAAVFDADAVGGAMEDRFHRLIAGFYNDAFQFDQMACSSPRLIVWLGDEVTVDRAKHRFWSALGALLEKRAWERAPAMTMTHFTTACLFAGSGKASAITLGNRYDPVRVQIDRVAETIREGHCGGGFFVELTCASLAELVPQLTARDQTLAVFGLEAVAVEAMVSRLPRGAVDRIVPVGQALAFDSVWDGYQLMREFTRHLRLPPSQFLDAASTAASTQPQ